MCDRRTRRRAFTRNPRIGQKLHVNLDKKKKKPVFTCFGPNNKCNFRLENTISNEPLTFANETADLSLPTSKQTRLGR